MSASPSPSLSPSPSTSTPPVLSPSAHREGPDFVIIGAQKAGTSSLFAALSAHPCVRPPIRKEIHFFDTQFFKGLSWYQRHFPPPEAGTWTGEASPYYLPHPMAAERLAATFPQARLVVLLRNPIDRALSHYHHVRRTQLEHLDFATALSLEALRLEGEEAKLRRDPRYLSLNHRRYGYLSRGLYARQLRQWLAHFPREQFCILLFEDLVRDPVATLHQVEDFIGLPRWAPAAFPAENTGGGYADMPAELRATLAEFFRVPNANLATLLGRDPGWT